MYVVPPPQSCGVGDTDGAPQPMVYETWKGSNKFFLKGRFIFGPDVRSLGLTIFLIAAPVTVFCVFVARKLMDDYSHHMGISIIVVAVVYTLYGDQNSPGIIPLAIKDVFSIIQDTPGREFLLRVSYLEIYNEVINDLLDPTGQNLRVREDAQGTYVEGIKEEVVLSPGHALSFIAAGEEHRHVGSNNFNLFSSRSHTIFTLMVESSAHGHFKDSIEHAEGYAKQRCSFPHPRNFRRRLQVN